MPSASSRSRAAARRRSTRSAGGDTAGKLAPELPVLAVPPPAGDHVVARVQLRQQRGDVRRVVLEIPSIGRSHRLAAASIPALIAAVCPKLRRNRITRSSRRWAARRASSANVPSREPFVDADHPRSSAELRELAEELVEQRWTLSASLNSGMTTEICGRSIRAGDNTQGRTSQQRLACLAAACDRRWYDEATTKEFREVPPKARTRSRWRSRCDRCRHRQGRLGDCGGRGDADRRLVLPAASGAIAQIVRLRAERHQVRRPGGPHPSTFFVSPWSYSCSSRRSWRSRPRRRRPRAARNASS